RFAHKAVQGLAVLGHVFRDELEGNTARQTRVFGLIHHAHATTAQFANNAIVGERLADHSEGLRAVGANVRPPALTGSTLRRFHSKIDCPLRMQNASFPLIAADATYSRAEIPAARRQITCVVITGTVLNVVEAHALPLAGIDCAQFGRARSVEASGRVDDASERRRRDAGATDYTPAA